MYKIPMLLPGSNLLRLLFAILFILWPLSAAQAVPESVKQAFSEKYPDAELQDWEVDSNGYWEATYLLDGKEYRSDFSEAGEWVETERSIEWEDVPDVVRQSVRRDTGKQEFLEIEEETYPDREGTIYVFEPEGSNQDFEYDEKGKRLGTLFQEIQSPLGNLSEATPRRSEIAFLQM